MVDSIYINCRQWFKKNDRKNRIPARIKIGTYKIEMRAGNRTLNRAEKV